MQGTIQFTNRSRGQLAGKVNGPESQPYVFSEDNFYCDPVDLTTEEDAIFTTLALINGRGHLKLKGDTGAKRNVISK